MSLLSCNQLAHIEELLSQFFVSSGKPPYQFGRPSSINANTWLFSGNSVPSNKTGVPFGLNNGEIDTIWVGNESLSAFDLLFYHHTGDETNLTLLTTLSIPNTSRTHIFTQADFGTISIPSGVQLATRVGTTVSNPKNLAVYMTITGTA